MRGAARRPRLFGPVGWRLRRFGVRGALVRLVGVRRGPRGVRPLVVVVAVVLVASLLVVAPVPVPGVGSLLGASEVRAQSDTVGDASAPWLHRSEIVEGQTRYFEISNVPSRPEYYLRVEALSAPFTAEAGDLAVSTPNRRGWAQAVAPGSDGRRAFVSSSSQRVRFEVEAVADGDSDDETFGVQLCTTADCTGGTVLGDWTVTIIEPAADTTIAGAMGATVTIHGGAAVSVMEASRNSDNRDRLGTFKIALSPAPTEDVVIVGKADTETQTGRKGDGTAAMSGFARLNSARFRGTAAMDGEFVAARFPHTVVDRSDPNNPTQRAPTAAELTHTITVVSADNVVDTAGGALAGNITFRVMQADGSAEYTGSTITIPSLPVTVVGDDEATRVRVVAASTPDDEATEGSSTDTARFQVTLGRALAADEELVVPLRFNGATLGTDFTVALESPAPTGVGYADSADGAEGRLTFTGPADAAATLVVTAASSDGNTVSERLTVNTVEASDPWAPRRFETNLDGGACAGAGCAGRPFGDPPQRGYRMTLLEAQPGLTVIDAGDGRVDEGDTYSYTVRLNAAPSANVTVAVTSGDTAAATVTTGSSLTFTQSGAGAWDTPQTVTVTAVDNSADAADAAVTFTHDLTGTGTYAAVSDVTHDLTVVDDEATTVTMAGAGVRTSSSGMEISRVMVEGDATRVDRSLTISLGRALEAGEYVRIPLYIESHPNGYTPEQDPEVDFDGNPIPRQSVVSARGTEPRFSADVAWPAHFNDFAMTATGAGVGYEHVHRISAAHVGYRIVEFRGAGTQTATIELRARGGFDDGETYDEAFWIELHNDLVTTTLDPAIPTETLAYLNPDTNLGGGVEAWADGAEAWFGIEDKDLAVSVGHEVPPDWPFVPSGVNPGDSFRLIYVTSQTTAATSSDLSTYDAFVRAEITGDDLVSGGITDMVPYATSFKVIGEVGGTAARDHASFSSDDDDDPNVRIYWVGGAKVADNNSDFTDDTWDDEANPRHADGSAATLATGGYWTGSAGNGAQSGFGRCGWQSAGYPANPRLGQSRVSVGYLNEAGHPHRGDNPNEVPKTFDANPLGPNEFSGAPVNMGYCHSFPNTGLRPMYALSAVFSVVGEVSVAGGTAAEGSPVTFTVSRPVAESAATTVTYTIADGRGVSGTPAYAIATGAAGGTGADYTNDFTGAGTVTIAASQTDATFSVPTTADTDYEGTHHFTVTLTGAGTHSIDVRRDTATGTITDDADKPTFAFSAATATAGEGDGTVTLTVDKTGTTLVPASVYWTTADGTGASGAAHPGDYTAAAGTLVFAAGETSKTITIDITDDEDGESAETFTVTLSSPLDATLGSRASAVVTVNDDDGGAVPEVTIARVSASVVEGGDRAEFTVTADPAPTGGPLTVNLSVSVEGAWGFTNLPTSIDVPTSGSARLRLTSFDDSDDEADGSVTATVAPSTDSSYTVSGSAGSAVVAVTDDDPTVVSLARTDSGNIAEGGSGAAADAEFTVTLGRRLFAGETVVVPLVLSGGDAFFNEFVVALASGATNHGVRLVNEGTLAPRVRFDGHDSDVVQTATVTLAAREDLKQEAAETVTVALGPNDATRTGFDNSGLATNVGGGADPHGTANTFDVGIDASTGASIDSSTITEGETKTFTISGLPSAWSGTPTLAAISGGITTISASTPCERSALVMNLGWDLCHSGRDFVSYDGSTGVATFTATARADAVSDRGVIHFAVNNSDMSARIDFPITVEESSTRFAEFGSLARNHPEGTATLNIPIRVSPASQQITLDYTLSGTAVLDTDYSISGVSSNMGTLTVPANTATVTLAVTVIDDTVGEPAKTIIVTLNDGTGYSAGFIDTHTVTRTEDDPGFIFTPPEVSIGENDTATYTVQLTVEPTAAMFVVVGVGAGTDLMRSPTILSFPQLNWANPKTVTLNAGDDPDTENDSVTLTHAPSGSGHGYDGVTGDVPVTIVDDDAPVTATPVTVAMAVSGGDGDNNAVENASDGTEYVTVTLTLGRALTGTETVTVPLTVQGATVADDYTFALQPTSQTGVSLTTSGGTHTAQDPAVEFASGASSATLRLTAVNNSDRTQPAVSIAYGTSSRAPSAGGGATLGDVSGSPITVVLVDDETDPIVVAADWALKPSAVAAGDEFRLLFVTSESRTAESTDIDEYDAWVQGVVARGGHAAVLPYGGLVKVVGGTASVAARVHTGMFGSGAFTDAGDSIAIYWLAASPNHKVADSYSDFYDNSWDGGRQNFRDRNEAGQHRTGNAIWTGSASTGRIASMHSLGSAMPVYGNLFNQSGNNGLSQSRRPNTRSLPMYGISPVFQVEGVNASLTVAGGGSVAEGGDLVVTVTLSENLTTDVTIPVEVATSPAATATVTDDYTLSAAGVTITAGNASGTLTLSAVDDDIDEGASETLTLKFGTLPGGVVAGSPATAAVTITDDDTAGITIDDGGDGTTVGENGGTDTYTVVLDSQPLMDVTVSVIANLSLVEFAGPGTPPLTFTQGAVLTFTPDNWNVAQTVTVRGLDDDDDEEDDAVTVTVTHLPAPDGGEYKPALTESVEVTFTDDDDPYVDFTRAAFTGSEAGTSGAFGLSLENPKSAAITVDYTVDSASTATHSADGTGADYVTLSGSVTIPAGDVGASIDVVITDDMVEDAAETIVVTLAAGTGYRVGVTHSTATMTITDDDVVVPVAPVVEFAQAVHTGGEASSDRSVSVGLTASPAPSSAIDVAYTIGGSAVSGTDYTTFSGPVSVGTDGTGTITIAITDDMDVDCGETIRLTLTDGAAYDLGTQTTTTVRITDDDGTGVCVGVDRTSAARALEGSSGVDVEPVRFTVSLSRPLVAGERADVALGVSGAGVDASDFNDLALASGAGLNVGVALEGAGGLTPTVVFDGAGAQVATLELMPFDSVLETPQDEVVTVAVAAASTLASDGDTTLNGQSLVPSVGAGSFMVTVEDDEHLLTFDQSAYSVGEGAGPVSVGVTMSRALSRDVHVYLIYQDVSATDGADYRRVGTYPSDPRRIAAGDTTATFSIPILDDALQEGPERVRLIARSSNLPDGAARDVAVLTIADDEPTGPIVSVVPYESPVFEGTDAVFTVTRSVVTASPLAVAVTVAEANSVDYIPAKHEGSFTGDIAAGAASVWVTVPTVDNNSMDSAGGGVELTVDSPVTPGAYTVGAARSATVVVEDNDTPGVSARPAALAVSEVDVLYTDAVESEAAYEVRLNAPPDSGVTVTVTPVSGDTSAVTVPAAALTFTSSDWDEWQATTATGVADSVENPDQKRTVTVTHTVSGTGNYQSVTSGPAVTVDVLDADPVMTVVAGAVLEGDSGTAELDFTVTISPASLRTVTVDYGRIQYSSATPETDHRAFPDGRLSFAPGETTKKLTVIVNGDTDYELNESVSLIFGHPTNSYLWTLTPLVDVTGVIINDDFALEFSETDLTVDEVDDPSTPSASEHVATYTVELTEAPTGDVTVDLALEQNCGAACPVRFNPSSLTFTPAGGSAWNVPQTVTVTSNNDDVDNAGDARVGDIVHNVVAPGTNMAGAASQSLPVGVRDDEAPPVISVAGGRVLEGGSGTTTALTYTATLSHPSGKGVSVSYAQTGGTAASGADYEPVTAGVLRFAGRATTAAVDVTVNGDTTQEMDETVVLQFSSPSQATLSGGVATLDVTGTIQDDDAEVAVSAARTGPASVDEGSRFVEGGKIEFTVSLSRTLIAGERVDVPLTISGTGVNAGDFAAAGLALRAAGDGETLNAGVSLEDETTLTPTVILAGAGARTATLVLEANDDELETPRNETVTVTVGTTSALRADTDTNVSGGVQRHPSDYTFDTTVVDDEYLLTFDAGPGVRVSEGDGEVTLELTLSRALSRDVVVWLVYEEEEKSGWTTSGEDYAPAFAYPDVHTIEAGDTAATLSFDLIDDTEREPVERLRVTAVPAHLPIGYPRDRIDVRIVDNDFVTMTATDGDPSSGDVIEGASDSTGHKTITLALGRALTGTETVTVPLTVAGATVATDFTFGLQPSSQTGVSLLTAGSHSAQNPAVRFAAGASSAVLRFTPVNNTDRSQPAISISYGTGARAPSTSGGLSVGAVESPPVGFAVADDESGVIEVASDWALRPSGEGGKFRLLFITSEGRDAASTDIEAYNDWAQEVVARLGHAALLPYGGLVKVVGSTASTDARVNAAMWDPDLNSGSGGHPDGSTSASDPGVAVYWLAAPPTAKVADNYFDFFDNTWNNTHQDGVDTFESGGARGGSSGIWTGSTAGGVAHAAPLGGDTAGDARTGTSRTTGGSSTTLSHDQSTNTDELPFYVLSPVFMVEGAAADLSITSSGAVTEGGTLTVTVTLDRNAESDFEVPVRMQTSPAPTASAGDFTLTSGGSAVTAVMISGGSDRGSVTFTAVDDDIDEDEESLVLEFGTLPDGVVEGTATSVTVTITDNDMAGVTVAESGAGTGVPEDDATMTDSYTVVLDSEPLGPVVVRVSAPAGVQVDGPAAGRSWVSSVDLTFTATGAGIWSTAQTVTVRGVDDDVDNPGDARSVTIGHAVHSGDGGKYTAAAIMVADVEVTVSDEDLAPTRIDLSTDRASAVSEGTASTSVAVTATVHGSTRFGVAKTVRVSVAASADSSSVNYVDMTAVSSFDVVIPAGARTAMGSFDIEPDDDNVHESDNSVAVTGAVVGDSSVTVNAATSIGLTNDDAAPTAVGLAVSPSSVTEGGGAQSISVTASVGGTTRFGLAKTVQVSVAGHDTSGRVNFAPVSGFGITIPAEVDDHSVSFTLTPVVNVWSEADGEAAVSGTLSGVTVSGASVTLTDDDAAPSGVSLSVSTSSLGEADGATVITVTATVDGSTRYGSARSVTVTVAGSGGTNVVDFTATAPPAITISAGAETGETTFTLTPTDDSVDEFDETVTVSGSGTGVASVSSAAITLTDDDATSVGLSAPAGAVGEAGGTKDVTVGLSRALVAGESVSVPLDVVGVTAGDDYTLALHPSSQAGVSLSQSGSDSAQAPVVSLGAGASSAVLRFTAVDNAARTQPFAVVKFGSGARAPSGTGVSIAAPSGARAGWAITDDETGDIVVPRSWALGPSGVNSAGEPEFRLVFATSAKRDASSGDIGVYDSFVRGLLAEGHVDIVPYAGFFTVLGSTSGAALADHAGVAGSASVPFYWLGETGDTTKRVAAGDMGFRGEWISTETPSSQSVPRDESGTVVGVDSAGYWTGSTAAGGRSGNPLGSANVTLGYLNDSGAGRAPLGSGQTAANSATRAFFGLSPVFVTASDPVISVTLPSAQAASDDEGDVLSFTVGADPAPDGPLTVQLWVSEPSGRAMVADGLEGLGSVSFAAGETSKAYTVATTQDSDDEADSRVEVRVFGAGAGAGYTAHATAESASVLVRDDEATTITLGGGGQTINEGQTATVTVTLGRDLLAGEEVDVPLERASASTATANVDWTAACSGGGVNCTNIYGANPVMAITGGAGTQQVGTITFTALPDAVHPEAAETIDIDRDSVASAAVTGSGGGVSYTGDPGAITITSVAPAAITASFDSDAYSAGEDAADRAVTVQVNLSTAAPSGGLTVTYTASGSAAAADYSGASGSVSIAAGQTSANISIGITDDALAEGSETLVLTISDGAGYDPGTPAATTITIADNDPAPGTITLTVDDASVSEGDGATAIEVTATIVGSSRFATAKTVAVSVAGSGAQGVVGFTASPTMFNISIAAGAISGAGSFTLTPQNDNLAEGDETVTVSGSLSGVTVNSAAVTLTDDDGAPTHVTLTVDDASVSEGDGATAIGVTATVVGSSRFATAQTVSVSVAGSGAANVVGFTAVPSMFNVSIAAGAVSGAGSFTLTPQTDNLAEGDETVTVSGSLSGVTVNSATIALTDDDGTTAAPVTVALAASGGDSDGNAREGAAGATGHVTVTVTLGRALSGGETVTVPLTVQGATVTSDYSFGLRPASQAGVSLLTGGSHSAQDPAVRFTAGAATATLRLTPVNNSARTQPYVVVAYGTGARVPSAGGGATLGAVTGGPVGVVLVDNETGDITVASSWGLAPSGLSGGDDFRLLFRSSTTRDATSADIGLYDAFVRGALAEGGHADIKPYAGFFKVFASTRSASGSSGTTARVHNAMTAGHTGHFSGAGDTWADGSTVPTAGGAGTPTYWLNGALLANNYADLCDQAVASGGGVTTGWDVDDPRSEDGTRNIASGVTAGQSHQPWTGSGNACEAYDHPLGNSTVSRGASHDTTWAFMHEASPANTQQRPLYGYSPVFKIAGGAVVPVADFAASASSAAESAGTTNIMLRLAPPPSGSVAVAYTLGGDAARGSDYTISGVTSNSGTVMVGTSGTAAIPVVIIDDMDVESAETVTITLDVGAGYTVGATRPAHTLTITDDDATDATPRMSFASATHRAVENEVARYPTVWMRPVPSVPVTVNYVLDTGRSTATLGEDYRLGGTVVLRDIGGGLLAFSVDVEANHPRGWAKFSVYFIDDEVRERDETVVFELRGGSGYVLGDITEFTLTIADDGDAGTLPPPPARPTVRFASAASATSESAGARNVALDLSPAPTQDITVRYSVSGSAARGSDYTIAGFGSVDVAAGARRVSIPVAVIDDGLEEGDETVVLALSGGSGYTVGSRDRHTLRITDDDLTVPRLTVTAGPAVPEGDAASFTINSTHRLSNLAVRYTVTQNGDYVTSGAPGAKTRRVSGTGATFTIPTRDDGADEADGSVTVTLNPAAGYTVGSPGAATVTVTDDDVPRAVFAAASSRVDEDAGGRNVRIDISPAPHEAISVGYRIGGTATPGSDYTALSGTVNVAAGSTSVDINITVIDDAALERNETIILTLSGGAGYTVGSPAGHTLTIDDDEEAPAVSFAAPAQTFDENTGTRNVALNVAPAPTVPITVRYRVGGSAVPGFDYTRLPGSVRVDAGATSAAIPIAVTNDTLVEGDETIVLELSGPLADDRYTLGATPWHTITIADDDATDTTPRASFFESPHPYVPESTWSRYPTTVMTPAPTAAVTIDYILDTNAGTATLNEDYQLHGVNALRDAGGGLYAFSVDANLDDPDGYTKFTVRILEDDSREGDETIIFRIQPGTGYAPGETTEYTLTITDND